MRAMLICSRTCRPGLAVVRRRRRGARRDRRAAGETLVATIHAQGAQVYECKADASGKLAWQFREPIATLLVDGKTVGRHYAGPNWELADGSAVAGKVSRARARRDRRRHPAAAARGHVAARRRPARQRHDDPEAQHQGRRRQRALRAARGVPQRALLRPTTRSTGSRTEPSDRAERRRRYPAPVASPGAQSLRMSLGPTHPSSRLVVPALHRSMEAAFACGAYLAAFRQSRRQSCKRLLRKTPATRLVPAMPWGAFSRSFSVPWPMPCSSARFSMPSASSRGLVVPKTIDTGPSGRSARRSSSTSLLLIVFALQHSVMAARPSSAGGRSSCRPRSSAAPTCCSRAWR